VEQFLNGIGPEALLDLDAQVEATIKANFTALVNVCLTNAHVLKGVESAMLRTAAEFARAFLPPTSVAEMFHEQFSDPAHAEAEVAGFFEEARPELTAGRAGAAELCVLAIPPGTAGDHFQALAQQALAELEIHPAPSPDDILIYRELSSLPLADLELLGPAGQDAYRQMTSAENFTPHTRIDVNFKRSNQ
jgi:hypothetical protein